jgi:hypothetical protein
MNEFCCGAAYVSGVEMRVAIAHREDASPQSGQGAVAAACAIGRTKSNPPQQRHR